MLIFDEIVTGFRLALGGAQEYFNVIPDLATFGNGMANGMPLNAVVGRADIMKEFEEVFFSTTFGGECLSLAAGLATVKEMIEKDVVPHIWKVGERLRKGLEVLGLELTGYPCRLIITSEFDAKAKTLLLQELVKRRVLIHSRLFFNLCYTHREDEIDLTLEAFAESLEIVNRAIEKNYVDELLEGEIIQSV